MDLQARNLKPNARGEDVQLLQNRLRELGFSVEDRGGFFGSTTFAAVQEFQRRHNLPITGIVQADTARLISTALAARPRENHVVMGSVRNPDGSPVSGVLVRALEKRLRQELLLGEDGTDQRGRFQIEFPQPEGNISLIVRVFDRQDQEIGASEVIGSADPSETVDVLLGDDPFRGPSEFRRLEDALLPILQAEEVAPEELAQEDLRFLARKYELNPVHAAYYVVAARRRRETDVAAEAYYGLFRQGLPTELAALVAQPADVLQSALETSLLENIVGQHMEAEITEILRALRDQIVGIALRAPEPDRPTFESVLGIAAVDVAHRRRILEQYLHREDSVEAFWDGLRGDPDIPDQELDDLQHTIRISAIGLNHIPLVGELMRLRASGAIGRDARDLSRFSQEDWHALLATRPDGSGIGAPLFFGEDEERRIERFAAFLPRMVEALFPTAVMAHRLQEFDGSDFDFSAALLFFQNNPDFEFRETALRSYLDQNPDALRGVADEDGAIELLTGMQRLFEIAPAFEKTRAITALLPQNIASALAVRRLGPTQFIRTYSEALGGNLPAQEMYTKAARKADASLFLLSQSQLFNPTWTAVIDPHVFGPGLPDLEDLFGSLDLCACEHCNSVYSPAAYLVELLHFLMNRPASEPGRSALDVLFERRPDIGEIELSCHNTNTLLPYTDLVNEILENAVAPGGSFPFQTLGDAEALGANPEHIHEAAYTVLGNASYPRSLPFDLFAEEARVYLNHLGVPRHELMTLFQSEAGDPSPVHGAAEYLGLTAAEHAITTGATGLLHQLWGFDSQADLNVFVADHNLAGLMRRSGLSYQELQEVLDVPLVNPNANMTIQFAGADCNLNTATITNLDLDALDRWCRFMRLQQSGDGSIAQLGDILHGLDADDLTDELLVQLATFKHLEHELKVAQPILTSWFTDRLDTRRKGEQPSYYEHVFRDPTVHIPPDLEIFILQPGNPPVELLNPDDAIGDHAAVVYGALGIDAADLSALRADELSDDNLNLVNLTRLYQAVSFAKALDLSMAEFLKMRALTGIDPLGAGRLEAAARFVELLVTLRRSAFSVDQLDFLLRDQREPGSGLGLAEQEMAEALAALREGLGRIALEYRISPDPDGSRTEKMLSLVLPQEIVGQAMGILDGRSALDDAARQSLLEQHFSTFMDAAEAVEALVNPGLFTGQGAADVERRAAAVLEPLSAHLAGVAREHFVVRGLSDLIGVELGMAEKLLRTLVPSAGGGTTSLAVFLDEEFLPDIGPDSVVEEPVLPSVALFAAQFATLHRLDKTARLLSMLAVSVEDMDFLFSHGPAVGWLDPNDLPLEPVEDGSSRFEAWAAMIEVFQSARHWEEGPSSLLELLATLDEEGITRGGFLDALALRTGWNRADLGFLTGADAFDLRFPEDFRDGLFAGRLRGSLALLRPLGVTAAEALPWAAAAVSPATARAIKQAARARYETRSQWVAVAPPLRDALRDRQRAALVDFLVHENELEGPNFLYAFFLIDVEMDPCMRTSRIVLASHAVQLFVQRCLLNLEPDVELAPKDAEEWAWMKNYRVWEANRKVFLYPENWIQPQLRDDKTPFFKALESGLLQDEINEHSIEREYLKYLHDLNRVGQLEICGLYRQWEVERDNLHVFGRTYDNPHAYYYRRWEDRRYWTPWEPLELDIEGDHLVPVVWNRRLYLFWPIFLERAFEETFAEGEDQRPRRYYEVRLAWSERRQGKWLPKRVSDDFLMTVPERVLTNKSKYSFWTYVDESGGLYIAYEVEDKHGDPVHENPPVFQFRMGSSEQPLKTAISRKSVDSSPPPGTSGSFNAFVERGKKPLRLVTSATMGESYAVEFSFELPTVPNDQGGASGGGGGGIVNNGFYEENIHKTSGQILKKTPGKYRLVLAHAERPHRSQAPLFYQDDQRTFFVVPRGGYVGGVTTPGELTFKLNLPPLELPDITTGLVARYLSGTKAVILTGEESILAAPAPDDLLSPTGSRGPTRTPAALGKLGSILEPAPEIAQAYLAKHWEAKFFRFDNHYHPYVPLLLEQLQRHGIDGMLKPDPEKEPQRGDLLRTLHRQLLTKVFFWAEYQPNNDLVDNVLNLTNPLQLLVTQPLEEFDFSYGGAYSVYNWELFFHAPFMLAMRLSENQRFAEAQRWFHYIFDPTYTPHDPLTEPWPKRVWQIKPFFEQGAGKSIQRAMLLLKSSGLSKKQQAERAQLIDQIEAWRKNPFSPHLLARMRPETYMRAVVMAYLDNLIAWADHLFQQDSMESINEATQIYILAAEILGERPLEIPANQDARRTVDGQEVRTFNDLRGRLDAFSNVLVELETLMEPMETGSGGSGGIGGLLGPQIFAANPPADGGGGGMALDLPLAASVPEPPDDNPPVVDLPLAAPIPSILGPTLFFCIPKNDKLLRYWDRVDDRLFKIRHCMNIEGVTRQLPLFQPPIDPALLVKATAAGVDIGDALSDLNAPLPHYRFQVLVRRVAEMINEVKSLGGALLANLEKKDAEELALLRSSHELRLLQSMLQVKENHMEEAKAGVVAIQESRKAIELRHEYYRTRPRTNQKEDEHLQKLEKAHEAQLASQVIQVIRGVFAALPNFDIGIAGISSPVVKASWGGSNLASILDAASRGATIASTIYNYQGNKASIEGGFDRREEDWRFQADSALKEMVHIDKQIAAAEIRTAVAEKDLQSHQEQIQNAAEMDAYLHDKYTGTELYSWMISQISTVYFQSYQLAYDLAKQAERAYRHELGLADSNFIRFGYWDNLKRGLLAGEKLQQDLKRMKVAYLEQNRREYEITQHFSLAMLNPAALLRLRETGTCEFDLPELAFDISYPGHYLRRIKSVSISVPRVTGPYTNIGARLSLLANRVRINGTSQGDYGYTGLDDPNFRHDLIGTQSITTSGGQNDNGLFELSFDDERYLPFERAGAVSSWRLSLPESFRNFDYDTITDVLLHLNYTALEGGDALRGTVQTHIEQHINGWLDELDAQGQGLSRFISLKHELPGELHRFLFPAPGEPQASALPINRRHFPYFLRGRELSVTGATLYLKARDGRTIDTAGLSLRLDGSDGTGFSAVPEMENLLAAEFNLNRSIQDDSPPWPLLAATGQLDPEAIDDLYLLIFYAVATV